MGIIDKYINFLPDQSNELSELKILLEKQRE